MQIVHPYRFCNALEWRRLSIERNGLERLMGGSKVFSARVAASTPMPQCGRLSSRPSHDANLYADPDRQVLWRKVLAECGGDAAQADAVLAAQRRHPLTREAITRHNYTVASALVAWPWPKSMQGRTADFAFKKTCGKPLGLSKDWGIRAPKPEPQLVKWLHDSHAEWAARLSKSPDTHCEQCGVRVTLARPRKRIFCGEPCSRDWYNANRPKVQHAEKACLECGHGFRPTRTDSKFCSDACRQRSHRKGLKVISAIRDVAHEASVIQMVPETMPGVAPYWCAAPNLSNSRYWRPPLGRAT